MAASSRSARPGEFHLLAKVRAAVESHGRGRGVLTGIGDDCAVVAAPVARAAAGKTRTDSRRARDAAPPAASLLLTTDTMVEGVHFERAWLSPRQLGLRAFRAAVSDIAAMGGRPDWALLSLEIPAGSLDEREALALVKAVSAESRAAGAALVGGNVSGGPRLAVTVTVVGETAGTRALLRSHAKPGDLVFVTGALGGAAAGWRALAAAKAPRAGRAAAQVSHEDRAAATAFRVPPLRLGLAAALAAGGLVHAMIDVSDGLLQDLGHVADESRVSILVDASLVPVHRAALARRVAPRGLELALAGGEDYELAFTAPPSARAAIERLAAMHRTPLSVIGFVEKALRGAAAVTDLDGNAFDVAEPGFDHLRRARRPVRAAAAPRASVRRAGAAGSASRKKPAPSRKRRPR